MPVAGYVEVYCDSRRRWRWRQCSSNGRLVAQSKHGYRLKWRCKRAARRIAAAGPVFDR